MYLIIQIPCYNEEYTITETLRDLPKTIPGISRIETLVIDDGSADKTAEVARKCGVDHVVILRQNSGLATAFMCGIESCLRLGADIIVNTDGDNQYSGHDIAKLVAPIVGGRYQYVVGCRNIHGHREFSILKKAMQLLGSRIVRWVSGSNVLDVTSGFRAYSRDMAMEISITSRFTYTLETIIQASMKGIAIGSVPININPKTRSSRLFKNMAVYIAKSAVDITRIMTHYKPLRTFTSVGSLLMVLGLIPCLRFLYYFLFAYPGGHIQSLILGAMLMLMGTSCCLMGLLADQIARNRKLLEEQHSIMRRMQFESQIESSASRIYLKQPILLPGNR